MKYLLLILLALCAAGCALLKVRNDLVIAIPATDPRLPAWVIDSEGQKTNQIEVFLGEAAHADSLEALAEARMSAGTQYEECVRHTMKYFVALAVKDMQSHNDPSKHIITVAVLGGEFSEQIAIRTPAGFAAFSLLSARRDDLVQSVDLSLRIYCQRVGYGGSKNIIERAVFMHALFILHHGR